MELSSAIGAIISLLVFGGLAMTAVPPQWQTLGVWVLLSLLGIPVLLVIAMSPTLGIGAVILLAFAAGGAGKRR